MKIAYIIRAHQYPELLKRLVDALRAPGVRLYIHIDKKVAEQPFRDVLDPDGHAADISFVNQRVEMNWGGYSMIRATLNALHQIIEETADDPPDYFFLLSGQDYPILSNREIAEFMEAHRGKEFLSYAKMPVPFWSEREMRRFTEYQFYDFKSLVWPAYHTGKIGIRKTYRLYITTQLARILLPKRKIPDGLVPYGGSAWWALSLDCIQYCLKLLEDRPEIDRYFKWTSHPEEIFWQTIIMNSEFADNVIGEFLETHLSDYLRFQIWGPLYRPRELLVSDWDDIIGSGRMFARKFDENVDAEILRMIDERRAKIDSSEPVASSASEP